MKNHSWIILIILIITSILIGSIAFKYDNKNTNQSDNIINDKVNINNKELNITYENGYKFNEQLTYGNIYSKIIKINNNNEEDITYALKVINCKTSNSLITFNLYASNDNLFYEEIRSNINLNESEYIGYNLIVEKNSSIYLKVEFKANKESDTTSLKGRLSIVENLTEKEIFVEKIKNTIKDLNKKIDNLNGIIVSGLYLINVNELKSELNGYILVDATDIASIKYILFVNDNNLMVNNIIYQYLKKTNIVDYDNINRDDNSVCREYSKEICNSFSSLTYNSYDGKEQFYNDSINLIDEVKKQFNKEDKKVYIIDVTSDVLNSTDIRGYILINNTLEESEYYLYLANNLFMISGYNWTKLGKYEKDSTTIRSYTETSFNLSASSKAKVCSFSGFSECYDNNNQLIIMD